MIKETTVLDEAANREMPVDTYWDLFTQEELDKSRKLSQFASNIYNSFFNSHFQWKIKWIKNYTQYSADKKIDYLQHKSTSWKSVVTTPLTKILTDGLLDKLYSLKFSMYIDFEWKMSDSKKNWITDLNYMLQETSWMYEESVKQIQDAWQTGEWFAFVDLITRDVEWEYIKYSAKKILDWELWSTTKQFVVEKIEPIYEYVPWSRVIFETNKSYEQSRFHGVVLKRTKKEFLNQFWYLLDSSKPWDDIFKKLLTHSNKSVMQTDAIIAKRLKDYEISLLEWWLKATNPEWYQRWVDLWIMWIVTPMSESSIFQMKDYDDEYEVYIHIEHSENEMYILINWMLVYNGTSPYGEHNPIIRIAAREEWWVWPCEWASQSLVTIQKMYDNVFNSFNDALRITLWPMFTSQWSITMQWTENWTLEWEDWKVIKVNGDWDIKPLKLIEGNELTSKSQNFLEYLWSLWSMIVRMNRYSWPSNVWGIERSPRAADYQRQRWEDVLRPISHSITLSQSRTLKLWLYLLKTRMPQESLLKIPYGEQVIELAIEDIINNMNITFKPDNLMDTVEDQDVENILKVIWIVDKYSRDNDLPEVSRVDSEELIKTLTWWIKNWSIIKWDKRFQKEQKVARKIREERAAAESAAAAQWQVNNEID